MKEEKKKKATSESEAGGFLGGLFKKLGDLIDLADKVSQEGGTIQKQGEFTVPGQKEMKGVYGFTIRTLVGPGGERRPIVQPFGNIKKLPKDLWLRRRGSRLLTSSRRRICAISTGWRSSSWPTGHWPQLTRPVALGESILAAVGPA